MPTLAESQQVLKTLNSRFQKHMHRHKGIVWKDVQAELEAAPQKLFSLQQMEESGGEPDVVGRDNSTGEYLFYDCVAESPKGRRSPCYDRKGWESRREARPESNAIDMAKEMGIEILTEEEYRYLQTLGTFDAKTSSWLKTPADIRGLGGALFADFRYGHVFVYHNGAQSYYGSRGFRGVLKV